MRRPPTASREKRLMADLRRHEGVWEGTYTHVSPEGEVLDRHASRVTCSFPRSGPYAYRQENVFTWADGRTERAEVAGILSASKLVFETEAFTGEAWSRDGVVFFETMHRAAPEATCREVVMMGAGGLHRARTWHWFEGGRCVRRTLCDETLT